MPAFLSYLVKGAMRYFDEGLMQGMPDIVVACTKSTVNNFDELKAFLDEKCTVDKKNKNKDNRITASILLSYYNKFLKDRGNDKPMHYNEFHGLMASKDFGTTHKRDGNYYYGIIIREESSFDE